MPDYRPDAPSLNLFTADEELVLETWFEIDRWSCGRRIDNILDGWNIPSEIPYYRRIVALTPLSRKFCWSGSRMVFQTGPLLRATVLSLLEVILIAVLAEKSSCGPATC